MPLVWLQVWTQWGINLDRITTSDKSKSKKNQYLVCGNSSNKNKIFVL